MRVYINSIEQKSFFTGNNYLIFGICAFLYLGINLISNVYIYTDEFYSNAVSAQYSASRIQQMLSLQRYFEKIGYLVFPLILFFKIALPAACIYIFLLFQDIKVTWKEVFRITLIAEIVFIAGALTRVVYFLLFPPRSIEELASFSPFSIARFFPHAPTYFSYALQSISVFELAYWIMLGLGLKSVTGKNFSSSLFVVMKSYGAGLLVWIVFMTWLLIQFA